MEVQRKFDIGDKVWSIVDNRVQEWKVWLIVETSGLQARYKNLAEHISINEDFVFATKQELLDSL